MSVNLQGVIAELITDLFMINDGFSAGQKLAQIEKTAKKRYYNLSDQEIYNALLELNSNDYYTDTFYSEEELNKLGS